VRSGDLARSEAKRTYVNAAALERLGKIGRGLKRALDCRTGDAARNAVRIPRLANTIPQGRSTARGACGDAEPGEQARKGAFAFDVVRVLRIYIGRAGGDGIGRAALAKRCSKRYAVESTPRCRIDRVGAANGPKRLGPHAPGDGNRSSRPANIELPMARPAGGRNQPYLRGAYEELRDREYLAVTAAQAGAFLGRALLLQRPAGRRSRPTIRLAEAERTRGADLKAGIAWR
jgi:hypothetical protein